MHHRTGSADLPLHGERVPSWLAARMSRLGAVITEAITHHYGRDEVLRRLAHPFWFQSFGAVMGMDWHSSGITTSVIGALKRGLAPVEHELGIHMCGGRGKHSRQTPQELLSLGERECSVHFASYSHDTSIDGRCGASIEAHLGVTHRPATFGGRKIQIIESDGALELVRTRSDEKYHRAVRVNPFDARTPVCRWRRQESNNFGLILGDHCLRDNSGCA